ncbi:MAG: hypothetical protein CMB67_00075 [Euryarchaeota archaeon]|nr:hypothetical protein [Euryarchaeota archaeon]
MSERLLGAVVGMHGDDKGLIMPPSIAPIQVVMFPIAAHADENVSPEVIRIASELSSFGLRVEIDDRDVRPGVKHYDWEIKGVPIRIELGPRDLAEQKLLVTLRTGGKTSVGIEDATSSVKDLLESISDELRSRSESLVSNLVRPLPVESISTIQNKSDIEEGQVYEIAFDGNDSDAELLEKSTGLTLLGECENHFDEPRKCVVTGKLTTKRQHIARMY